MRSCGIFGFEIWLCEWYDMVCLCLGVVLFFGDIAEIKKILRNMLGRQKSRDRAFAHFSFIHKEI